MPPRDGEVLFCSLNMSIGGCLPIGAAGAFDEAERFVKVNRSRVVSADVKPDIIDLLFAGMLHGAFCERAGDSATAKIGMDGDIGNEIKAMLFLLERHEADVAHDAMVFLPNVARERKRGGFCHAVRPFEKGVIGTCAAHILHIAPAVAIHGAGEAQLDQVRHGGQVLEDVERTQMRVTLSLRRKGDGGHWGNYTRVVRGCIMLEM